MDIITPSCEIQRGDPTVSALRISTLLVLKHFRGTTDNILGRREVFNECITDAGRDYLIDAFTSTDYKPSLFNWHDFGCSSAAESTGDTALITPTSEARVLGTQSQPASNQYRTVGLVTFTTNFNINEHGLFNQEAKPGGTLLDRTMFGTLTVVKGDSIQGTFTLKVNSGG